MLNFLDFLATSETAYSLSKLEINRRDEIFANYEGYKYLLDMQNHKQMFLLNNSMYLNLNLNLFWKKWTRNIRKLYKTAL